MLSSVYIKHVPIHHVKIIGKENLIFIYMYFLNKQENAKALEAKERI